MTPTVHYHTLDGEVPNGGVPPDRLAIAIRQPPQPAPPQEDPPSGGMALVNPIIGLCNPGRSSAGFQTQVAHCSHQISGLDPQNERLIITTCTIMGTLSNQTPTSRNRIFALLAMASGLVIASQVHTRVR